MKKYKNYVKKDGNRDDEEKKERYGEAQGAFGSRSVQARMVLGLDTGPTDGSDGHCWCRGRPRSSCCWRQDPSFGTAAQPVASQLPSSQLLLSFYLLLELSEAECRCPLPHSPHPPPSGLTEEAQKMPQHLRGFQHFPPSPLPPLRWAPQTRPPPQRREPPQHRPPRPPCQCQHSPCPGPTSSPPPSSCPSSVTLC